MKEKGASWWFPKETGGGCAVKRELKPGTTKLGQGNQPKRDEWVHSLCHTQGKKGKNGKMIVLHESTRTLGKGAKMNKHRRTGIAKKRKPKANGRKIFLQKKNGWMKRKRRKNKRGTLCKKVWAKRRTGQNSNTGAKEGWSTGRRIQAHSKKKGHPAGEKETVR